MSFLEKFLAGDIPAADFHHIDHVRAGYELLRAMDFLDAVSAYGRALKIMTARVGKPEKLHHTITIAFLAVIADRMAEARHADFDAFLAANPMFDARSATVTDLNPSVARSTLRTSATPATASGVRAASANT